MAVKIARAEPSAIRRTVGILQPRDSVELHHIPMTIRVKQKPGPDGTVYNEVKSYAKKEAATGPPQQATGNLPPWKRQENSC